jgi:hypothetical protein
MAKSVKQAILRVIAVDLASFAVAFASLRHWRVLGQPSWITATIVLVVGFAFAASFGIAVAPSMGHRAVIVAASVLLGICCFSAVMYYFLNTYGA